MCPLVDLNHSVQHQFTVSNMYKLLSFAMVIWLAAVKRSVSFDQKQHWQRPF